MEKEAPQQNAFSAPSQSLPSVELTSVTMAAVPASQNSWEKQDWSHYLSDYDQLERCLKYQRRGWVTTFSLCSPHLRRCFISPREINSITYSKTNKAVQNHSPNWGENLFSFIYFELLIVMISMYHSHSVPPDDHACGGGDVMKLIWQLTILKNNPALILTYLHSYILVLWCSQNKTYRSTCQPLFLQTWTGIMT